MTDNTTSPAEPKCLVLEPIEQLETDLVDLEVSTFADLRTLVLACETLATATELEATIRREGFTIECATDGHKAHPALKALEPTRNAAHRILSDFGLSPKSRKFVSTAPGKRAESVFARYRNATTGMPQRNAPKPFAALDDN